MTDEEDEDVAGTVEIKDEDGTFDLPDDYVDTDGGIVVRTPGITSNMPSGAPLGVFWFDTGDHNPELSPDKVSLKHHGEDAEIYRVEGVEQIDD